MTWSITSLISKAPRKKKFSDFHQVCICKVPYLGFTYCFVRGSIRGTFSLTLLVAAYQPRTRPYHSQDLMRRYVPNGKSRIPQPEDQFQVCLLHWPDYLRTHFGLRRQSGLKYCTRQVAGALTWKDGLRHLQSIVFKSVAELRASDVQALTRKKRKNGISKAVVPGMGRKVPTKPELHGVNPIPLGVMLDYLAIICTKEREKRKSEAFGVAWQTHFIVTLKTLKSHIGSIHSNPYHPQMELRLPFKMRRARFFFFPRASISSGDDEAGFCGRTDDFEDIHICCGKVEEEKRGDHDDWIRSSQNKTRKERKKKRKTKRTVTTPERRARRRASSSPAERMW